jgi:hypothetical protein
MHVIEQARATKIEPENGNVIRCWGLILINCLPELLVMNIMTRRVENILEMKTTVIEEEDEMLHSIVKPRSRQRCTDKYWRPNDRYNVGYHMLDRMSVSGIMKTENEKRNRVQFKQVLRREESHWSGELVVSLMDELVEKL